MTARLFGLIPAAGHSRRMGAPKLLLPWGEGTIIGQVLRLLGHSPVAATVVVCRAADLPLQQEVLKAGGKLCLPDPDPEEMRYSVQAGLKHLEESFRPQPDDGWLLIPADHPLLSATLLEQLIHAWQSSTADVLVPTFRGHRGHPSLVRWRLAQRVPAIPADKGLNSLFRSPEVTVQEFPVEDDRILLDLDTPEDYARWVNAPS
ncbi:MAG: nucleotidyltransferase family protein [Planctomycetales bacterium]